MQNELNGLSALSAAAWEIEAHVSNVERLGAGLGALAALLQASDEEMTMGHSDIPVLHGVGCLVEALGLRIRAHGAQIGDHAHQIRVMSNAGTQS
ncbi:MAG TPA: hypothetical protein DCL01_12620 [Thauera sp.]|nr:hypothetical protein [Thauera sp.]HHW62451.1 hypothetical protein [Rhodocyclaceae bacterium]